MRAQCFDQRSLLVLSVLSCHRFHCFLLLSKSQCSHWGGGIFLNRPSYNKPIKKMKLSGQTVSIIVIDFELKYKIIAFVIISIS